MRILFVNRWYPSGGVGNYIKILSSALADLGHEVSIITASLQGENKIKSHDSRISVYSVRYSAAHYYLRRMPITSLYYRTVEILVYAWRVEQMRRKLEREIGEFDIVEYAEVNSEGLFHPPNDTPYVVTLHLSVFVYQEVLPESFDYSTYWISRFEKKFIRRANMVASPSLDLAVRVSKFCDINLNDIEIIVNPINMGEFDRAFQRGTTADLNILFIGYLDKNKGAFLLAEAIPYILKKIPYAQISFIGHNRISLSGQSGEDQIRKIIGESCMENVRIIGGVSHSDLLTFIRASDICVTPSSYENCPYAALEVMASARPLIATRNSGFVEIICDGETGLLFEPGSVIDLAEKIIYLAVNPTERNTIGKKASAWVAENCSAPIVAQKKIMLYRRVLDEKQ
jgi:glycosyltransferase involved in cell wall biosynthesis